MKQGEIIMYQPDESIRLEVRMEEETVWLNLNQMSLLFGRDKSVISRHIRNVYIEGELLRESTVANFATVHDENGRRVSRNIEYYNLDVIISVGYRVKSIQGTRFRQWANSVLKEYLLRGYAINQRFERLERRVTEHDAVLSEHSNKLEFFVRAALPPKEGVFSDGQIFDAYAFASELIKSARQRIVLIDNYIDESVLLMLAKRNEGVTAEIVTRQTNGTLALDIDRHNRQYPPITIRESPRYHDRFLIVDDIVYHIGASLKDLGKKLFAFSKMELAAHEFGIE
ncbi:MAG: virulence RhuM family protein [Bacteroidales bacterium]|nr:virulence RhuM family protein [Bacteroidales bacterium]